MSKQIANLGTVEELLVKVRNLFEDEFRKELAEAGQQAVFEARENAPEVNGLKGKDIFYFAADGGYTAVISAKGRIVEHEFDPSQKPFIYPAALKQWNLLYDKFWTMLDG